MFCGGRQHSFKISTGLIGLKILSLQCNMTDNSDNYKSLQVELIPKKYNIRQYITSKNTKTSIKNNKESDDIKGIIKKYIKDKLQSQ